MLLSARIWNEQAQRLRGLSVQSHEAVIELWDKAARALSEVFFSVSEDAVEKELRARVVVELKLAEKAFKQLLPSKNFDLKDKKEILRWIDRLEKLKKFGRVLGPIGELQLGLALSKALYYFGLVSYHAVLRDSADYFAEDSLAKAAEDRRRAQTVCTTSASAAHAGATRSVVARTAASKTRKKQRPVYAKLPKPKVTKSFRAVSGLGMSRRLAARLNGLLAAHDRAGALARAMRQGLARASAARRAKKRKWEVRQLAHVRELARKLATHLDAQEGRRRQVAGALTGRAVDATPIQVIDPVGLARAVRRLGILDRISARLRRLGLNPRELTGRLRALPRVEFAVPSLADALADPLAVGSESAWATELRAFAAALSR